MFIADPGVGVVQSGVVHSFRDRGHASRPVAADRRAMVAALQRLTGATIGDKPAKWRRWYRANR